MTASVFALTACNNRATTQGQLSNFLVDHNKEYFEYDVKIGSDVIGVYKVNVTAYLAHAVINCPDEKEVEKGIFVESELDVNYDGKHIVYNTGCFFTLVNGSSLMLPSYTYRVQSEEYDGHNQLDHGRRNPHAVQRPQQTMCDQD